MWGVLVVAAGRVEISEYGRGFRDVLLEILCLGLRSLRCQYNRSVKVAVALSSNVLRYAATLI